MFLNIGEKRDKQLLFNLRQVFIHEKKLLLGEMNR